MDTLLYHQITDSTNHLTALQRDALQKFKDLGFPNTKQEAWKYTDVSALVNVAYQDFSLTQKLAQQDILEYLIPDTQTIVIENGKINRELSDYEANRVVVEDVFSMPQDILNNYFSKLADYRNNSFVAANTAKANGGIYLRIGATTNKPFNLIYINTQNGPSFCQLRNVIIVDDHVRASIVEQHVSLSKEGNLLNVVNECFVNDTANLSFYKVQLNDTTNIIDHTFIASNQESQTNIYTISVNKPFVRNNLNILLKGRAANTHLYGISYLSKDNQLVDNHTLVEHRHPECRSYQLYKGVYSDASKGVFNGKIVVAPGAEKTEAFQRSQNVLLSVAANVFAKPELEIFADDVKCSHGCTVGQINQDAVFYMQSRGISKEIAQKMLTYAFVNEIVEKIANENIKQWIEAQITN